MLWEKTYSELEPSISIKRTVFSSASELVAALVITDHYLPFPDIFFFFV